MKMKTFWLCFFIFAFLCNDTCTDSFEILNETECKVTKECLKFNYIPHDLPDNVTRVVLQDVHNVENIKKGTFDGKNWDKVTYLLISKTPQRTTMKRRPDRDSQSLYSRMVFHPHNEMNDKNWITTTAPGRSDNKFTQAYKRGQLTDKYIKSIEPYAMENLKSLKEFYIESNSFEGLDYGSFAGLDKLKVLSFKMCEHLKLGDVIKAINGSETLPNLQTLSTTYINVVPLKGVEIGKEFFTALSTKPLQLIDLHKMLVRNIQMRYLRGGTITVNSLRYINISGITLNAIDTDGMESFIFKQPRLLDVSSVTLPMDMFRFVKFLPLSNLAFPLDLKNTTILTNFQSLDFSDIYHSVKPIELYNVTVFLLNTKHENWHTKNLILRKNNLKYLDVTIPCINSSFEMIDLSENGIKFLRPNFCPCCFNLKKLHLSDNKLDEMSKFNYSLFSQLFNFFPSLKELYLISNELTRIPEALFKENIQLEILDLSHNKLEQVRFHLQQLKNLKLLNLQYNQISMLDITSLNNLKSFQPNISGVLDFRHNPISCSKCDTLLSIQWFATSNFIIRSKQDFVCVNNEDTFVPVDKKAVISVQNLCDRPKRIRNIILLGTFVPVVLITLLIATTCIIMKFRRHKRYITDMAEKVRLIQEDATDVNFVVFLCFSNNDEDFVSTYVYQQLNQYLQNFIGTNRDLVAYGDKQFRPGQSINDEMVRCLEQSSVMIMILSHNFCASEFCRIEFDHALRMDKPIILMLKEEVMEDEMVPSLRHIFRKNARILWENKGDGYQLKTSWENVCTSILELVQY